MTATCGCRVGWVRGLALWVCAKMSWTNVFDDLHGGIR